ncbi:MAG: acetyl-CoA carboxylase carboxyl transferase subunit alpha, partial [Alphaproteobacteria bacterium]
MDTFLDFEKPIAELEGKIKELRHLSDQNGIALEEEVLKLEGKVEKLLHQTYAKLTP